MIIREYRYGNAIIKITRPELSDKEAKEKEKRLLIELQIFGKAMEENKYGNGN